MSSVMVVSRESIIPATVTGCNILTGERKKLSHSAVVSFSFNSRLSLMSSDAGSSFLDFRDFVRLVDFVDFSAKNTGNTLRIIPRLTGTMSLNL